MKLAAFTLTESVMKRWAEILRSEHTFLKLDSISEMKSFFLGKETILFLLHRSIADKNVLGRLCSLPSPHKIFIFSDQPNEQEGLFFLQKGAIGYANTNISPVRLHQAVDVVLSGRVWVGQKLMNRFVQSLSGSSEHGDKAVLDPQEMALSDRENDIARLIAKGFTNSDIANDLNISERTVKAHLSSIYKKTNTQGRLQLALKIHKLLA